KRWRALQLLPHDRRRLVLRPCRDRHEVLDPGQLVSSTWRSLIRQHLRAIDLERRIHERVILVMEPHRAVGLMLNALSDIAWIPGLDRVVRLPEPRRCRTDA